MPIFEVFADNHFDPPWSHFAVASLDALYLCLGAFCVQQLRRARAAAREASSVLDPQAPLREGAQFVAGTVERARDAKIAARVTIWQEGTEQRGKKVTHHWAETSRNVETKPFYVRHAGGTRVRVEPGRCEVLLVDKLDQTEWTALTRRGLRAELTPGERVIAEGALRMGHDPEANLTGTGYRDAAQSWVLEPRAGRMHFSTESLARRHELRAGAFAGMLALLPFLWLLGQVPLATYRARALLGEDVRAEYTGRRTWTTRGSRGGTYHHYAVGYLVVDSPAGPLSDRVEIDRRDYEGMPDEAAVDLGLGPDSPLDVGPSPSGRPELWVRVVPGFRLANSTGRGSSVGAFGWALSAAVAGGAAALARRRHAHRRWYEAPQHHAGEGPLPSPTGQTFDAAKNGK